MTDLAETALAFAKECMDKPSPRIEREAFNGTMNTVIYYGAERVLIANDLDSVMVAMREWALANRVSLELNWLYTDECYHATIIGRRCYSDSAAVSTSPCHALLAACVAASRKLRGGA